MFTSNATVIHIALYCNNETYKTEARLVRSVPITRPKIPQFARYQRSLDWASKIRGLITAVIADVIAAVVISVFGCLRKCDRQCRDFEFAFKYDRHKPKIDCHKCPFGLSQAFRTVSQRTFSIVTTID